MWSTDQRNRLDLERRLIKKYFPDFSFYDIEGSNPYLLGSFSTDSCQSYTFQIFINDFPYKLPSVYIISPRPLLDYNGKPMTDYKASHSMHTLTPSADCVQPCMYRSENWDASITLVKLLVKARLWIEAYEWHLETGESISAFLSDMN